ncbi:hypothetical protein RIF29_03916 [Crotalaria pallida]|uniref:Pyridine nucleotide-disulphide oxidoreductase N-terminal domain-containing protein n=1 Tax=Crotalaria pallida TaxID=3830 RepID=A0AAN9P8X6_CROPI
MDRRRKQLERFGTEIYTKTVFKVDFSTRPFKSCIDLPEQTTSSDGGGNSTMEEATFLVKYSSEVHIIHKKDMFRASKIMQAKALNNKKIGEKEEEGWWLAVRARWLAARVVREKVGGCEGEGYAWD